MKSYSLHIGLNSIDPKHYGVDGKLNACEADANSYETITKSLSYDSVNKLLTKEAKCDAILNKLDEFSKSAEPGDIVVITYAGHGSQISDFSGDEEDSLDETWVLYDRQLVDDELFGKLTQFKEEVRVFLISDSCHSGTVCRAVTLPNFFLASSPIAVEKTRMRYLDTMGKGGEFEKNRDLYERIDSQNFPDMGEAKASIILMSGCQDSQFSMEGNGHGKFTEKLLKVWNNGSYSGTYHDFYIAIRDEMPLSQIPNFISHNEEKVDWKTSFSI